MKKLLVILPLVLFFLSVAKPSYADGTFNASNISLNTSSGSFSFDSDIDLSKISSNIQSISIVNLDNSAVLWNQNNLQSAIASCTSTSCSDILANNTNNNPNSYNLARIQVLFNSNQVYYSQVLSYPSLTTYFGPLVNSISGATIITGNSYTANGSFTDNDTNATSWTATVDYGDGFGSQPLTLEGKNFILSHTYSTEGNYTVIVTVTNDQNVSNSMTTTVNVTNVSITAMSAPESVPFQMPTNLVVKFTNINKSKDTVNVDWGEEDIDHNTNNGSSTDVEFSESNGIGVFTAKHVYTVPGTFGITVTIKNSEGDTDTKTISTSASNFTVTSADPSSSSFTWTGVSQNCSAINSYLYTLPSYTQQGFFSCDTSTGALDGGSVPDGQYQILLSAGQGLLSQIFAIINGNFVYQPIVNALNNVTTTRGVSYSSMGSFTDANTNANSWTATVDYGDGSGPQPLTLAGQDFSLQHTYETVGAYIETVTITNNLGATNTVSAVVIVNPNVISISGPSHINALVGTTYSNSGSFKDPDPDAASWIATVDFGDGSGGQSLTLNSDKTFLLNHTYNTVGSYLATIMVTNNLGEIGTLKVAATVDPLFTASNVSFDPATNILTFDTDSDWSSACSRITRCGASQLTIYDADNNAIFEDQWSPNSCLGNGECQIELGDFDPTAMDTTQFYMQVRLFGTVLVNGASTNTLESQLLSSNIFSSQENSLVTAINVGGDTEGSFAADTGFTGGSTFSSSSSVDTSGVTNPAPQAVYQTVRYGNFTYTVPNLTPNTDYTLRLHFNEVYFGANGNSGGVGSRVFNVSVNGTTALSNFDIYQTAGGANKVVVEELPATSDSSGNITLQFSSVVDNAMVNGIEVDSGSPTTTPTPTPTPIRSEAINAGGGTQGSFQSDIDSTGGSTFITTADVDTTGVTSPAPESVYQSVRYGNFTYDLTNFAPNSSHTVRLHFSEPYWGTALSSNQGGDGSRVFNVSINGTQVLSNFDIYQSAGGADKAIIEEFPVTADTNGKILLQFTTVTDNAMVNGIEVN